MAGINIGMDTKEWKDLVKRYGSFAKLTTEEAFQKKAGSVFFFARENIRGKFGNAIAKREQILQVIENPKFIAWYLNQVHGKGNWGRQEWDEITPGKGHDDNSYVGVDTKDKDGKDKRVYRNSIGGKSGLLTRRLSAIKFMYWVLSSLGARIAQHKLPVPTSFKGIISKRTVLADTPTSKTIEVSTSFVSVRTADANSKLMILNRAIIRGEKAAIKDIELYILKKMAGYRGRIKVS